MYALDIAREIFEEAAAAGMQLRIMDIGGGFPIPEPKVRFNLQEMLNQINARLTKISGSGNLGGAGAFYLRYGSKPYYQRYRRNGAAAGSVVFP